MQCFMYYDGSETFNRADGTEITRHYLRHNDRKDRMGRNLLQVPDNADVEGPLKVDELMEVEVTVYSAQAQSKKDPSKLYNANCIIVQKVRPATAGLMDELLGENGSEKQPSSTKAAS